MSEVWADSFVEEANISRTIWMLRRALGEDKNGQDYIQTIPKHGYRFVADVSEISPANQKAKAATANGDQGGISRDSANAETELAKPSEVIEPPAKILKGVLIAAFVVLAIGLSGVLANYLLKKKRATKAPAIKSLAVLPLKNVSGDSAQDYLVDGMTEGLISNLARIRDLRVIASKAVMQYKDSPKTRAEIATDLNVDAIVQGSFFADGKLLRVEVELVDATTENKLWSDHYEQSSSDMFVLQKDITNAIARKIRIDIQPSMNLAQNINPEAYDLYLHGCFQMREETKENYLKAIALQERAIKLDPNFAPAFAELARASSSYVYVYAPQDKQMYERAVVAVEHALAISPDLAEAHLVRALLLWTHANGFPHEQAIEEYKYVLELNPNLDEAHQRLGIVYHHIGMFDKALAEYRQALDIDPTNNLVRLRIGAVATLQHRYQEAINILDTLPTDLTLAIYWKGLALVHLKRLDEAANFAAEALKDRPQDAGGEITSIQALIAALRGDDRLAEKKIKRTIVIGSSYDHFHHSAYHIAMAYAILKKPDEAMKWLEIAANDGLPCYPAFEADPFLENLHQDPRFIEFMAKQKEIWETRMKTL